VRLLIDVTRDFRRQARGVGRIDGVLLTHAHRDACGGIPELRRWLARRDATPLRVFAAPETIMALERRHRRLDHCDFAAVRADQRRRIGQVEVVAVEVPHARERHFPTFAWKLRQAGSTLVYASDVARLTPELERFSRGASVLVIDGAMWGRRLFSHLTIDRHLPRLCDWRVDRILLTQIGRTAPPHDRLIRDVRNLCPRAEPAHDGLKTDVG
jgi:phosphoribosyl 1,2-cyclic phosphodiesterase